MTQRQTNVLRALISTNSIAEAAAKSNVSVSTVKNYLSDKSFSESLKKAQNSMLTEACIHSQSLMSTALDVLKDISMDSNQNGQARVSASRSILEYSLRLTEANDFENRISALERREDKYYKLDET